MELDYQRVCRKALGTLRRRAVTAYIEAEELTSVGYVALVEKRPATEALAVKVARDSMIDAVRSHEVRERGRVWPAVDEAAPDEDTDTLDTLLSSGGRALQPEAAHIDLWEAMKALPPREYQIVTLHFWGGKSQASIADELGVSQMTVSRSLENVKKIMAECLKRESQTVTCIGAENSETHRTVLSSRTEAA